jgi:Ca2+-transporting ATPase
VQEGRTAFINLRKTVGLRLAQIASIFLTVLVSLFFFPQNMLTPAALLWVGGVSSVLFTIALAREVPQWNTMRQPPRAKWERLLANGVFSLVAAGVVLCALTVLVHYVAGATAAFAMLALGQCVLFMAARSSMPLPLTRLFYAPWTWVALISAGALFVLPLTVPAAASVLGLSVLESDAWNTVGLLCGILFAATELYKWARFLFLRAMRSKGAND